MCIDIIASGKSKLKCALFTVIQWKKGLVVYNENANIKKVSILFIRVVL